MTGLDAVHRFIDASAEAILARAPTPRRALFLDRDGVVNVNHGYVHTAAQTDWVPGIFELAGTAQSHGFLLVVVTNQAGIARGIYSEAQFIEYTRWMHGEFAARGLPLLATFYCPHHPGAGIGEFGVSCTCRKPQPDLILAAARAFALDLSACVLVGDQDSDIEAAIAAGVGASSLVGPGGLSMLPLFTHEASYEVPMLGSCPCPVCLQGTSSHYADVDGLPYLRCALCRSIHVEPHVLLEIDQGGSLLRDYGPDYWAEELAAARSRAQGVGPCRAGEAILYCRRKVEAFLDIGAGPGFLLESLIGMLDPSGDVFHAVEKFAPEGHFVHPNYHHGTLADLTQKFDAGICIEVVEHLTPDMLRSLAAALAERSKVDSYWLFNTGLDEYVQQEDPGYLDPYRRGHIVSYSVQGLQAIFEPHGFRVHQLPGKSFAFAAEFRPSAEWTYDERIYRPLPDNFALLQRNPLLHQAAFESARSYFYAAGYKERSAWALSLVEELKARDAAAAEAPEDATNAVDEGANRGGQDR